MNGSLVLASLEVGKALADSGRAKFRAYGTCMYPTVRPGDVLHVASRTVEQVDVGDIAVCRRHGVLFGHRAIAKGVSGERPFIVTRPDGAAGADDGPTFADDVLGVVTEIERRGRHYPTAPERHAWPVRAYFAVRLRLLGWGRAARYHGLRGLGPVQRSAGWKHVGKLWLALSRRAPSFVVWVPLRAGQPHDLHRALPADEFDVLAPTWQGRLPEAWSLLLRLGDDARPAVHATFVPCDAAYPAAGWTAAGVQVRRRYRGLGLEQVLMKKAASILARRGLQLVEHRDGRDPQ